MVKYQHTVTEYKPSLCKIYVKLIGRQHIYIILFSFYSHQKNSNPWQYWWVDCFWV